jgi:hypothetical protein
MQLEKRDTSGILFEGNTLKGLWFASKVDASDREKISWVLAREDAKGKLKTSEKDYIAATLGLCEITPAPANLGGFFLFFPSGAPKKQEQKTQIKREMSKKWWQFWK